MAHQSAVDHYSALATQAALSRFQLPANEPEVIAEDFDDALELACHVIASRASVYGVGSSEYARARRELTELVNDEIQRAARFAVRQAEEARRA